MMNEQKTPFSLTVLGSRGSMSVCRKDIMRFGGNTSCYMVRAGDDTVFALCRTEQLAKELSASITKLIQ